jgi:HicB family
MDLSPYVEDLRRELSVAADAGGDEARALAERLSAPLDPAVRLMLLDALSAAAADITRELAPGSVELRLRGGEPEFVVNPAPAEEPEEQAPAAAPLVPPEGDDGEAARINLRLPGRLKAGAERAASAEGLSLNAWLVRATAAALANHDPHRRPPRRGGRIGESYSGWVR